MFGAQPPRRLSIVSTRKLRLTPVHVLRQEVLGELAGKRHQVVEGDRAGDDEFHRFQTVKSGLAIFD